MDRVRHSGIVFQETTESLQDHLFKLVGGYSPTIILVRPMQEAL